MIYLKYFQLLSEVQEQACIDPLKIHTSAYPFGLFPYRDLKEIEFSNITIFYGGNGSGKTSLLNIIAENIKAQRKSNFNKGNNFNRYVESCQAEWDNDNFKDIKDIKIISSDDVFDNLLDIRAINSQVNRKKDILGEEYLNSKFDTNKFQGLHDFERFKKICEARKQTESSYIRNKLINNNIIEHSNGESALLYWQQEITENSLYLLDEPENSLSAQNQIKLKQFIEDSARFYNCQFIISTHSPFLLSLKFAKIYDLDANPVCTKHWTELPNVLSYYNFFKENDDQFNK